MQLFAWLSKLDVDGPLNDASVKEWLQRPRLSLADIRQQADASLEFDYREQLLSVAIPRARTRLREEALNQLASLEVQSGSALDPTHEQSVVHNAWAAMYGSLVAWISNHMYDIVGSVSMRFPLYFWSLSQRLEENEGTQQVLEQGLSKAGLLKSEMGTQLNETMTMILSCVNDFMMLPSRGGLYSAQDCQSLSEIFLAISGACNRICVGSVVAGQSMLSRPSAVYNKWIVATAPARIDLSGGWSDTPPICFEHGSSGKSF